MGPWEEALCNRYSFSKAVASLRSRPLCKSVGRVHARARTRTHTRTRTHAPSRPAHVKAVEEPLTGSGLAAAFTCPTRPRLTRRLPAGAHTWERTRGPSSSHCSISLSVFENEQRGWLSSRVALLFSPRRGGALPSGDLPEPSW